MRKAHDQRHSGWQPDDQTIDSQDQERLAEHINDAAWKVVYSFERHHSEDGLTGAFGQLLEESPIELSSGIEVTFRYRKFDESTEEHLTGADGGYHVRVRRPGDSPEGGLEKGALFQAKRLPEINRVRSSRLLKKEDRERFHRQLQDMLKLTSESVGVFYTLDGIYVVDAGRLASSGPDGLLTPLSANRRLISIGTYLGKWIARCTRGDQDPDFIKRLRTERGFCQHEIGMDLVIP